MEPNTISDNVATSSAIVNKDKGKGKASKPIFVENTDDDAAGPSAIVDKGKGKAKASEPIPMENTDDEDDTPLSEILACVHVML